MHLLCISSFPKKLRSWNICVSIRIQILFNFTAVL